MCAYKLRYKTHSELNINNNVNNTTKQSATFDQSSGENMFLGNGSPKTKTIQNIVLICFHITRFIFILIFEHMFGIYLVGV